MDLTQKPPDLILHVQIFLFSALGLPVEGTDRPLSARSPRRPSTLSMKQKLADKLRAAKVCKTGHIISIALNSVSNITELVIKQITMIQTNNYKIH